jgi:hypothetical protein
MVCYTAPPVPELEVSQLQNHSEKKGKTIVMLETVQRGIREPKGHDGCRIELGMLRVCCGQEIGQAETNKARGGK